MLLGLRPGYDTRLETAASIPDVQALIRARAKTVPAGGFITAMGGWNSAQFVEKRLPTLQELDAADSSHPVIVYQSFTGPAAVNTPGRAFFAGKGIAVSDAGAIAINAPSIAALDALRAAQTFADQTRGTLDALAYSASVGVTTNVDMGAFIIPGLPDIQDSFAADTLASADPFRMYDALASLHRDNKMSVRVRLFFLSMDTRPDVPMLKQRLFNNLRDFGDDMLRVSGVGEFASSWPLFGNAPPTNYEAALQLDREAGLGVPAAQPLAGGRQADDRHLRSRQQDDADRAAALVDRARAAHRSADHQPLSRRSARASPCTRSAISPAARAQVRPLRTIVDSGIHVGAGSDSAQISTLDPWLMIYYMVTGKNSSGVLVNPGQLLTRIEALRLYTAENGWFLKEENKLGTIEPGKLGDVVVLSGDYLDPAKVSDEAHQEAEVRPDDRGRQGDLRRGALSQSAVGSRQSAVRAQDDGRTTLASRPPSEPLIAPATTPTTGKKTIPFA